MRATSAAQFEATRTRSVPPTEQVSEGVWAVALPLPERHAHVVPYTLSYLVLDAGGDVHLVDTGWDSDDNWRRLELALSAIGKSAGDLATATVTHMHSDHVGLADRVRAASGAAVALHSIEQEAMRAGLERADRAEEWGVPDDRRAELREPIPRTPTVEADVLLEHGDRLAIPGRELTVLHTPGHTTGHICVRDTAGRIFTGDHVLPAVFPGLGLGADVDNPIAEYLAALELVAQFEDDEVLPAHGFRFEGLGERVRETAEHHRARTDQVATVLAESPGLSVWELASRLHWTLGWDGLRGSNLRSALAQTAWHREIALGR